MNTDSILSNAIRTLYPQVSMDSESIAIIAFLIVILVMILIVSVIYLKIKAFLVSGVLFFFALLVTGICCEVYINEGRLKENKMIQLLVTDPPSLERILQLRESIEWINNPVMQRNQK